jgi:hypothetical protein
MEPGAAREDAKTITHVIVALSQAFLGVVLLAAFFLSWLEISYVNSTLHASISWATYLRTDFNASQSVLVDLMVPAALAALVVGISGLLVRGRKRSVVVLIAFAASNLGVVGLSAELNSGALYPADFATISPGIGLVLFAGVSVVGMVLSAVDVALHFQSTILPPDPG